MREFVAVDVRPPGERAYPRAAPHLTLRFLGEVDPARNEAIAARLGTVAQAASSFVLRLEGVGAFPSPERPRVVWVGVSLGRTELVELARRVRVALEEEVGPTPEEFVPHLTLFRVRSPADRLAAAELLSGRRPAPPPREVAVKDLLLVESVLGREGATHRTLASFPLAKGRSGPS